jgi:hypothetical protein
VPTYWDRPPSAMNVPPARMNPVAFESRPAMQKPEG